MQREWVLYKCVTGFDTTIEVIVIPAMTRESHQTVWIISQYNVPVYTSDVEVELTFHLLISLLSPKIPFTGFLSQYVFNEYKIKTIDLIVRYIVYELHHINR